MQEELTTLLGLHIMIMWLHVTTLLESFLYGLQSQIIFIVEEN